MQTKKAKKVLARLPERVMHVKELVKLSDGKLIEKVYAVDDFTHTTK